MALNAITMSAAHAAISQKRSLSEFSGYRDDKSNPHPSTEGGITSSYLEQKRCDVELGYEAGL